MTKKRDIFAELAKGSDALQQQREGKLTLRTFKVQSKPAPVLSPQDVMSVREQLHLSRPVLHATCAPTPAHLKTGNKAAPNRMLRLPF